MKARLFYRIAAILMLILAAGHTLLFRRVDPNWGVDSVVQSMRSVHFNAYGSERTYWDFFVGYGLVASALIVLSSIVTWQLSGVPDEILAKMRLSAWGLVVCFGVVAFLAWRYVFILPTIFSVVILLCLGLAAWLSGETK